MTLTTAPFPQSAIVPAARVSSLATCITVQVSRPLPHLLRRMLPSQGVGLLLFALSDLSRTRHPLPQQAAGQRKSNFSLSLPHAPSHAPRFCLQIFPFCHCYWSAANPFIHMMPSLCTVRPQKSTCGMRPPLKVGPLAALTVSVYRDEPRLASSGAAAQSLPPCKRSHTPSLFLSFPPLQTILFANLLTRVINLLQRRPKAVKLCLPATIRSEQPPP